LFDIAGQSSSFYHLRDTLRDGKSARHIPTNLYAWRPPRDLDVKPPACK
jgi:hypothetical protein